MKGSPGVCDPQEEVLIILHCPTSDLFSSPSKFLFNFIESYAFFSTKHHAFCFLKEPEHGRKRDISQLPWQCCLDSDGGADRACAIGVGAVASSCQEASRMGHLLFLKLRKPLSEIATKHACQAHPSSMEIQGVITSWEC